MAQMRSIIDMLLTPASSMFVPEGYISEQLLPFIGVAQYTGKLAKYGNSHLRIENSITGGEGKYRRVKPIVRSQASYEIDGHGLEGIVTKRDYANVLKPYDAELDETIGLVSQLWVEKEKVLADALSDTSVITQTQTLSGTSQFSDYNNSNPMGIFNTAKNTVRSGCGKKADTAWMSEYTRQVLAYHPQLLDMLGFKYAKPGGLSNDDLAVALGVNRVLIADVSYNSAADGQTDVLADAWGKHIWFGVVPQAAQVRQVSLGYRLGIAGSSPRKVYKTMEDNPPESTKILVEDEYDFLLSNVGACYLIKNAVA